MSRKPEMRGKLGTLQAAGRTGAGAGCRGTGPAVFREMTEGPRGQEPDLGMPRAYAT